MTTIFPISLTCPVCKGEFQSSEIGSCGFASKRTDFRPNYWGMNPVEYFYHLCPSCGFCGAKDFYKKEITDEKIKQRIKSLDALENPSLPQKIEQAMICLEILNDREVVQLNNFQLANSWINAYWWAKNRQQEQKFGKTVLSYLKKALSDDDLTENNTALANYLIAEINRRLGNTETATDYFNQVILLTQGVEDTKNLHNLAKQQKTDPQENIEKNDAN
ncbi:MAG: DUF2225 domain-containing protein [Promethearchaeia archaeon]